MGGERALVEGVGKGEENEGIKERRGREGRGREETGYQGWIMRIWSRYQSLAVSSAF